MTQRGRGNHFHGGQPRITPGIDPDTSVGEFDRSLSTLASDSARPHRHDCLDSTRRCPASRIQGQKASISIWDMRECGLKGPQTQTACELCCEGLVR